MKTSRPLITLLLAAASLVSLPLSASAPRGLAAERLGSSANLTRVYHSPASGIEIYNAPAAGGFVIATPDRVIGYSDRGSFDPAAAPAPLLEMLEAYGYEAPVCSGVAGAAVAPLLGEIAWDQMEPYNLLCPVYLAGNRAATGCAATAMAQIMRYHSYPVHGQGSHSYEPSMYYKIGTLTVDFSQSFYDWENMLPRYTASATETEQNAVARLMYDAGVAISMDYGPQSGALSQSWPEALVKYFTYDQGVALRFRANYAIDDWTAVIRSELQAGRPVFATGFTDAGGHAFVFDGIDAEGLIHVNWGWSGMSNGYFAPNFLSPSTQGTGGSAGGFNSRQLIVTGICPPAEGSEPFVGLASEEGLTAPSKVTTEAPFSVRLNGKIFNVGWQNSTVDFGLAVADTEGEYLKVFDGPAGIDITLETPYRNVTYTDVTLGTLPSGNYRLLPVARNAGGSSWERVRDVDTGYPNYLNLTVDGTSATLAAPEAPGLHGTAPEIDGQLYAGLKGRMVTTISNNGETEYYGSLTPVLLDPATSKRVAAAEATVIDIMPGQTITLDLYPTFSAAPGSYLLTVIDNNYATVAEPVSVSLEATKNLSITAVSAPDFGDNSNVDPLEIRAEATVGCDAGVFSGQLFLYFYATDGVTVMGCIGPEFIQIPEGTAGKVTFTGRFENAMPGEEYDACVVNAETYTFVAPREKSTTRFRVRSVTAIDDITPDSLSEDSPTVWYNIQGVRLPQPPTDGLYIEVKGNRAVRKIAK